MGGGLVALPIKALVVRPDHASFYDASFLYLLPIKGGMVFQIYFVKCKYNLDVSNGFSLGMMIFSISLILTTVLGLLLIYLIPVDSAILLYGPSGMGICLRL